MELYQSVRCWILSVAQSDLNSANTTIYFSIPIFTTYLPFAPRLPYKMGCSDSKVNGAIREMENNTKGSKLDR